MKRFYNTFIHRMGDYFSIILHFHWRSVLVVFKIRFIALSQMMLTSVCSTVCKTLELGLYKNTMTGVSSFIAWTDQNKPVNMKNLVVLVLMVVMLLAVVSASNSPMNSVRESGIFILM